MLRDIIKDTEIYQIIMEEGWEKGLEQGREQRREEGLTAFHQLILEDVQERFSELLEAATKQVNAITDLGMLKQLAKNVVSADSVEQVRTLFNV